MQRSCADFAPTWVAETLCEPFGELPDQGGSFIVQFAIQWAWILIVVALVWIALGLTWELASQRIGGRMRARSERRAQSATTLKDFRTNAVVTRFWSEALRRSRWWTGIGYATGEKDPDHARRPVPVVVKGVVVGVLSFLLASPFGILTGVLALGIVVTQRGGIGIDLLGWLQDRPLAQVSVAVAAVGLVIAGISLFASRTSPHTRGLAKWRTDRAAEEFERLDHLRKGAVEMDEILDEGIKDWYRVCFPGYGFPMHDRTKGWASANEKLSRTRFRRDYAAIAKIVANVPAPFSFTRDVRRSLPRDAWLYLVELGFGDEPGALMIRSRWSCEAYVQTGIANARRDSLYSLAERIADEARRLREIAGSASAGSHLAEEVNSIATILARVTRQMSPLDRSVALSPLRRETDDAISTLHGMQDVDPADYEVLLDWCLGVRDLVDALELLDGGIRTSMSSLCELQLIAEACHRSLQQHLWPESKLQRLRARLS
ncbi:hypothetical protein LK459_03155 [Gordonia otitidis]|uniref:hypothetical protein n=1 Tax=Gordonia otitidis TaxID=249058 RepID=UPI001D137972|nr:hypothetical protein [Gordonia otitidis]UEA59901.1 hypothetical protein LK459_03155 [Gordonia otitidis]